MSIKTSFESPIKMLDKSFYYNDYDYLLYHLLDIPEYMDFAIKSKMFDRMSILDNSAYELGENYDIEKFVEMIKEVLPTYYILPDVIGSIEKTVKNTKDFITKYGIKIGKSLPMGVIQGSTIEEFIDMHNMYIDLGVRYIAIPHAPKIFMKWGKEKQPEYSNAKCQGLGRLILLDELEKKVIDGSCKYHILGVTLPQEINGFKRKPYINTIDTSNPILNGMLGITYKQGNIKNSYTLTKKPAQKMQSMMYDDITLDQERCILKNINNFKEMLND